MKHGILSGKLKGNNPGNSNNKELKLLDGKSDKIDFNKKGNK